MIFTGDIAAPSRDLAGQLEKILVRYHSVFGQKRIICNFEGLISERVTGSDSHPVLCNHPLVPVVLSQGVEPVLCLANNHTLDLPQDFDKSADTFYKANVLFCGAGKTVNETYDPLRFTESGKRLVLINACWDFLLYKQKNPSQGVFVAELDEDRLINEVFSIKKSDENAVVILFLHWSLDLEILPFPLYRTLSHALIDAGADLIIGSHSHCVQGGEKYRDKYILYGLGNFFMPGGIFAGGKIRYPEFARTGLVFEWDPVQNDGICHWFESQDSQSGHDLLYKRSERFEDSVILKQYSPYQNMSDKDYLQYFRANRRKRFLIPIYKNHKSKVQNRFKSLFLKNRARFAYLLARLNLIKWQN